MMLSVPVGAMVVTVAFRIFGAARAVVDAALEVREHAALRGQLGARLRAPRFWMNLITCSATRALLGVVRDAELDQHVREAHHAEADLAVAARHLADLRRADSGSRRSRCPGSAPPSAPCRRASRSRSRRRRPVRSTMLRQVDRAEVARLVRQQRLLAAGLVLSISPRCGVGLSRLIRSMKMIPGSPFLQAMSTIMSNTLRALSGRPPRRRARVDEVVVPSSFDRLHELLGDAAPRC